MNIADTIRQRLGIDLRELAGASVSGEIPVTNELVNRLLAERLRDHQHIESVQIESREGDAAAIEVVPRLRFVPRLKIAARIERQPALPEDPRLLVHWSMPAAGPLAMLAGPVLAHLRAMPPGIQVEGEHVTVDLRTLLESRGLEEALGFLRRLEIHSRPEGFVARFELGV